MLVMVAKLYMKKAMEQCQSLPASCSYCHIANDVPFDSSGVFVRLYEVAAGHSLIAYHMVTK